MERTFFDNFQPKLDALDRRVRANEEHIRGLETKFTTPPQIDFEITSTNPEAAIEHAHQIYKLFGCANLNLKVALTEAVAPEAESE